MLQLDSGAVGGTGTSTTDTGGTTTAETSATSLPLPDAGVDPEQPVSGCWPAPTAAERFFVQTDGDDSTGDGSAAAPWATISHAVSSAPDGSVIDVGPGDYNGASDLEGIFAEGIVVRAVPSYGARLRHSATVVTLARIQGLVLEGFDIAHTGPGADPIVVHVRDELGDVGGTDYPTRIVLRDNIIHDSYNNDLLKIDSGVRGVEIEGNVFFNQGPLDEQLDINAASEVAARRNIFFNDFEATGRLAMQDTASFVIVKDANGADDEIQGASEVDIDGNIFMRWQGTAAANFLLLAERGNPIYEARGVLVQNNLMVGDGGDPMRAPFGIKGATDVVFRNNTVVGDIPANAFAFRFNVEGESPPNDGISLFNNIWSSPSGAIDDLTDTELASPLENFVLDTNLYWNGGAAVPNDDTDLVNASSDANAVLADPQIDTAPLQSPVWDPQTELFGGGYPTICAAFDGLVARHGTPAAGGAAVDAARPDQLPQQDILGQQRTSADLGAVAAP